MLWMMTLAEIKGLLGIVDPIDDVGLTLKLETLQGRFENALSRSLARDTYADTFDGGEVSLFLGSFPVESVTSVTVAGELWEASTYAVYQKRGVIKRATGLVWPEGIQNIEVVYVAGYVAAGSVPAAGQYEMDPALRGAFAMQFEFEWRNRNNLGTNSMSAQGASLNLAPAKFLPEVQRVLDLAKRI